MCANRNYSCEILCQYDVTDKRRRRFRDGRHHQISSRAQCPAEIVNELLWIVDMFSDIHRGHNIVTVFGIIVVLEIVFDC